MMSITLAFETVFIPLILFVGWWFSTSTGFYEDLADCQPKCNSWAVDKKEKILEFSAYNGRGKGVLKEQQSKNEWLSKCLIRLILVDSKHRSINSGWWFEAL